ncbi:MAG: hypothetical protein KDC35_20670 [Acidobacteria bacterium]|nr:hypothetical protein [Acidobacteriota bacterium]
MANKGCNLKLVLIGCGVAFVIVLAGLAAIVALNWDRISQGFEKMQAQMAELEQIRLAVTEEYGGDVSISATKSTATGRAPRTILRLTLVNMPARGDSEDGEPDKEALAREIAQFAFERLPDKEAFTHVDVVLQLQAGQFIKASLRSNYLFTVEEFAGEAEPGETENL